MSHADIFLPARPISNAITFLALAAVLGLLIWHGLAEWNAAQELRRV